MSQDWTTPPPAPLPAANGTPLLVLSIAATLIALCGCWPSIGLTIPAIVFASQVDSKAAAGDLQGSIDAARKAKLFSLIAIGLSVLAWIVIVIYYVFLFGLAASQNR